MVCPGEPVDTLAAHFLNVELPPIAIHQPHEEHIAQPGLAAHANPLLAFVLLRWGL